MIVCMRCLNIFDQKGEKKKRKGRQKRKKKNNKVTAVKHLL